MEHRLLLTTIAIAAFLGQFLGGSSASGLELGFDVGADGESGEVDILIDTRPEDKATLFIAEQTIVRDCMAGFGFEWALPPYAAVLTEARVDEQLDRAQFPYDSETEGMPYSIPAPRSSDDPNAEYAQSLPPAAREEFYAVLFGDPDDVVSADVLDMSLSSVRGGCLGRARAEVFGDAERQLRATFLMGNLEAHIISEVAAQDDVTDAVESWATCMNERGYQFEQFTDARADASTNPGDALSIATADAACTQESALETLFSEAYAEQLDEWVQANIDLVLQVRRDVEEALSRARLILASS